MTSNGGGANGAAAAASGGAGAGGTLPSGELEECGCKRCITRAMEDPEKALNSVSTIDKISRVVFPLTFFLINAVYWYNYLKHSERIDLSFEDL